MTRQGWRSTGKSRAAESATKFGACAVHRREASSVQRALEQLAKRPLADLDPDATLGDLVPALSILRSGTSHDAVAAPEHYATVAQVLSKGAIVKQALEKHLAERIRSSA